MILYEPDTPTDAALVPLAHVAGSTPRMPYSRLEAVMRLFGVEPALFRACKTLGEAQSVLKLEYHLKARLFHPDMRRHREDVGRLTGHAFNRYTARYRAVMAQDKARRLHHPAHSVPDLPMPWAMEQRDIALPEGFNESRDYLWYR